MDNVNFSICCDVTNCKHNSCGRNCTLNKVNITHSHSDCTLCGSFDEQ